MSLRDSWGRKDIKFFYDNLSEYLEILTDEELGILLRKTIDFTVNGITCKRDDFNNSALYLAYRQSCNLQVNLGEKYEHKSKVNTENGRKGGEANAKRIEANASDKDKDKDKDKEKDKDLLLWFESLWKEYPLKRGKDKITIEDIESLQAIGKEKILGAIANYEKDRTENPTRATMHGSTFFQGSYKDYLPGVYEPIRKAVTEEEAKAEENKGKDRESLKELEKELAEIQAKLGKVDRGKDRETYNRLRDREAIVLEQIERIRNRIEVNERIGKAFISPEVMQ